MPDAADSNNKKPLTIKDVARQLGLHPQTVRKMVKAGLIPYYRHGKLMRFDQEHVDEYRASCLRGGTPAATPPVEPRGTRKRETKRGQGKRGQDKRNQKRRGSTRRRKNPPDNGHPQPSPKS